MIAQTKPRVRAPSQHCRRGRRRRDESRDPATPQRAAGFGRASFASAEALLGGDAAAAADCLLLDVHMPGVSGFELRSRLQARGVETPVIFMTTYDDPSSRARAQRAGAAGYLAKPFRGESLLAALAGVLGRTKGRFTAGGFWWIIQMVDEAPSLVFSSTRPAAGGLIWASARFPLLPTGDRQITARRWAWASAVICHAPRQSS